MKSFSSTFKFLLFIFFAVNTCFIQAAPTSAAKVNSNIDLYHTDAVIQTYSSLTAGNWLPVFSILHNSGTQTAGFHITGYYLSKDSILNISGDSSSDTLLGYSYINSVQAGGTYLDSAGFVLPYNIQQGNYFLCIVTDVTDTIAELNENNNILFIPLTVEAGFKDLFPSNMIFADSIAAGNPAYLYFTETNRGNIYVPEYYEDAFYISNDSILDTGSDLFAGNFGFGGMGTGDYQVQTSINIPVLPNGQYYLFCISDAYHQVEESDESNNTIYKPFKVASPSVDLVMDSIFMYTNVFTQGMQILASFNEKNTGTINSSDSYTTFYLSHDTIADNTDYVLSGTFVPAIPAGSNSNNYAYLYFPDSLAAGAYYIIAQADTYNNVSETNENNNLAISQINVIKPYVDLAIISFDSLPSIAYSNSYLIKYFYELNLGLTTAYYNRVGVYLSTDSILDGSDMDMGEMEAYGIPGGSSYGFGNYYYFNSSVVPGNYYFIVVADKYNNVSEANESNNIFIQALTILAPDVDLVPSRLQFDAPTLQTGQYNSAIHKIYNNGNSPVYVSTSQFYLSQDTVLDGSDPFLTTIDDYYIPPHDTSMPYVDIYIPPYISAGNYFVITVVDAGNSIPETNELNNISYTPVVLVGPPIDLQIRNVTISSTVLQAGGIANVSFEDDNFGTQIASFHQIGIFISSDSIFDFSDYYSNTLYSYDLYPSQSNFFNSYFYVPTNLTAGQYYVLFVDDVYNEVFESNEKNNIRYVKINVVIPNVDLKVKTPHLSVGNLIAGSSLTATDSIHNKGTDASLQTYTTYYLSTDTILDLDSVDVQLSYAYTPEVLGKSSIFNSIDLYIPNWIVGGNYYILFQADGYNQQAEKDESNNIAYKKLTVKTSTVDLTVKNHTVSKAKLLKGETFTVSCNEANLGNTDASGSYLGYFLSTDNQYSYDDVILSYTYLGVPAKSTVSNSASVTIPSNTPAGNYFILFGADAFQYVNETDETNNFVSKAITVKNGTLRLGTDPEPDVVIFTASVYPNPVNDQINVTVEGAAPGTQVIYTMVDIIGNKLKAGHTDLVNGVFSIPVSGLPAGIYILHIENAGNIKTLKVIKE